jgi:chromosome partitioning protein
VSDPDELRIRAASIFRQLRGESRDDSGGDTEPPVGDASAKDDASLAGGDVARPLPTDEQPAAGPGGTSEPRAETPTEAPAPADGEAAVEPATVATGAAHPDGATEVDDEATMTPGGSVGYAGPVPDGTRAGRADDDGAEEAQADPSPHIGAPASGVILSAGTEQTPGRLEYPQPDLASASHEPAAAPDSSERPAEAEAQSPSHASPSPPDQPHSDVPPAPPAVAGGSPFLNAVTHSWAPTTPSPAGQPEVGRPPLPGTAEAVAAAGAEATWDATRRKLSDIDLGGLGGEGAPGEAPASGTVGRDTRHPSSQRSLPRVLAIANQKGGVGKTTTAVNLGAGLAELGYRVLVVDLDPQGNASTGLGVNARNLEASVYDVILHDVALEDVIEPTSLRNLFLVPATIDLAGAEIELVPAFSRELRLRRALESVHDDFDFVVIDCPPSLGLLTVNGLAAAGEVVVPIQCEYYALEGLGQLLRNVNLVKSNLNQGLEVSTIVLTMYDARTRLSEQVVEEVRRHFGARVCRNVVPRTVRLSEAPSFGQPIIVFDPSSRGAIAYRELAKEVSGGAPQRVG